VASQLRVGTGELSAAEGSEFRGAANRIALNRAGELKSHVHRFSEGDFQDSSLPSTLPSRMSVERPSAD
jgi:hypothetical protein